MPLPDFDVVLGAIFLALPVLIGGLSAVLISRMRRSGGIEKALVNMVLHPTRRRRFLIEVSAMCGIVISGLVTGSVSLIFRGGAELREFALVAIFLAASATVLLLTIEGLRNTELTLSDGLDLRDNFPQMSSRIQEHTIEYPPNVAEMYYPSLSSSSSLQSLPDSLAVARRRDP
jgi:hypothetical protein